MRSAATSNAIKAHVYCVGKITFCTFSPYFAKHFSTAQHLYARGAMH